MFIKYLKESIRFFYRNKSFSLINIFGLTLGLTGFILILLFTNHELSFDNFHENNENVYRINIAFEDNSGNVNTILNSPPAFAPGARGRFAEVARISQLRYTMNSLLANGERHFYEDQGYYADSLFLEILKFDFSAGDPSTALDAPNSIVLTEQMAAKYFENQDPIGANLMFNNTISLKVTGIISSVPSNSHLNFDYLISFPTYEVPEGYASDLTSWNWLGFMTYVELKDNADPAQLEAKLAQLFEEINPDDPTPLKPIVQNLSNIYLGSSGITDDLGSHIRQGSTLTINSLMIIAALILVIAGFNFSSLTHAMSINRGKAIGIRKVLGARRAAVISQLLMESLLLSIACLILAYSLSIFLFPEIGSLMDWDIELRLPDVLSTVPVLILVTLLLGIFAGGYPAILLSGYNIIKSLKGEIKKGGTSPFQFKNVLVVLQFAISIALIAATFVVMQQINHLRNRPIGFDKENVVVIKMLPEDMAQYYSLYKDQLMQNTSILAVSRSERMFGDPWPFSIISKVGEDSESGKMVFFNLADYDFLKTMNIELYEGRAFSDQRAGELVHAIIINEEAASLLDLDDPIGQQVHFFEQDGPRTIIGVVKNFNYTSMHSKIGPAVIILPFINLEYMYVRLTPDDLASNIKLLEDSWNQLASGTPLEWKFLDDTLDQLYKSEERLSHLIAVFSTVAVALACLGLYGIVAFMLNNRIKEFGVRKVLGASLASLYTLFVRKYIVMMLLAMTIVIPLLHNSLYIWLDNFAYRINVQWWIYPLATLLLMIIALATMTFQTVKVARVNPAKVLRSE